VNADFEGQAHVVLEMMDFASEGAEFEQAFRTGNTAHLEASPMCVRTPEHTLSARRGKVMAAYLIRRELSRDWAVLGVNVEEGLHQLWIVVSTEMKVGGGASCLRLPRGGAASSALLKGLDIRQPGSMPPTGGTQGM
jgi:hypothetical protein